MEFIKITTLEGKSEFIAQNKIIAFHKMELSEKNKIELGEDKATLKIETLENRQFVAVGREEEIDNLIQGISKPSDFQGKVESVIDKLINPPEQTETENSRIISPGYLSILEDLEGNYRDIMERLNKLESSIKVA